MCDAEKGWNERSFRASGAINGCQKSPLDKPEMTFSFFIFKTPVMYRAAKYAGRDLPCAFDSGSHIVTAIKMLS